MPKLRVGAQAQQPIEIHYEDYGTGKPVVLIHGWPLSGRAWERQVPALVEAGYRVIAYDRRGFGQSSQPWTGYEYGTLTADLHELITHLDLRDAMLVGFSMGGGEVARYIGTHGTERVAKAVFAAAATPYMYKCADNPEGGLDDAMIAQLEGGVAADRLAFLDGFISAYFSVGGKLMVSEAQRVYARAIASVASPKATLDCIAAFSYTDFRTDLEKFDLPTLIIHSDSDAIVPIEVSGARTHKIVSGSVLSVIKGSPHGLNLSHAAAFNQSLLQFLNG